MRKQSILMAVQCLLLMVGIASSISGACADIPTPTNDPMPVRYHLRPGITDAHNTYQFELIHQALEITRTEYGEYLIQPYGLAPTAKRQAILLGEGDLLNIQWASPGTPIANANVIPIPIDILKGLLGYRVCLINKSDTQILSGFTTSKSLEKVKIGQGQDWTDIAVYQYNNIPVVEAPNLEGLFRMIALQRFECIALGLNEVLFLYNELKEEFPFLAVEQHTLIYYEFPTYLYVSKRHPKLAERIALGLKRMQNNGDFDRLFNQFFAKELAPLNLNKRTIICLKSPYLDKKDQCAKPAQLELL